MLFLCGGVTEVRGGGDGSISESVNHLSKYCTTSGLSYSNEIARAVSYISKESKEAA